MAESQVLAIGAVIVSGIAAGLSLVANRLFKGSRPILLTLVCGLIVPVLFVLLAVLFVVEPDPHHSDMPLIAAFGLVVMAAAVAPASLAASAITIAVARRRWKKKTRQA